MLNSNVSFAGAIQIKDKEGSLTVDPKNVIIDVHKGKQGSDVSLINSHTNESLKDYYNIYKSVDDVGKDISKAYEKAAHNDIPTVLDLYA